MLILLLIAAFIFFVAIAPIKTTITFAALMLLILCVVKISTRIVTGNNVSLVEAFKAVGLSLLFACIAVFALTSFSSATGIHSFTDAAAIVVIGLLFSSYIAGFSVALGTTFGSSTAIAAIATAASGVLIAVAKV
ncbi:hypothetical protein [Pseudomonas sp. CC6-YY-74]|uniref:hypothetical protein n=1 Tax=Pseudomonas sp. CC6-YY-74 TaxID=1930532 RepID=UPI0012AC58F4|nr:hypothetical protein [Pseudomonas sp. CC6-YY-74]